jgi:hypothetical protein
MHTSTGCSALEDLAAFAEGRLHGAERERMITHLAGCADCRELLADSLETYEDLAAAEGGLAPVVELPPAAPLRPARFGWVARATSLAAAALVAVSAVALWQANARRSPPDRGDWLAAMPSSQELAPHLWGGVVMRGEGDVGESARQATELGALVVDLDVALAAGDGERARDFLHRMATILEDVGLMDTEVEALRETAALADVDAMRSRLGEVLPGLEAALRDRFDGFFLDLGTFLEEAQLAARAGRADFLDSAQARRYLAWVGSAGEGTVADAFLDRLAGRSAEDRQLDIAARQGQLEPVKEELRVLGDTKVGPTARADAAQRILEALTG